MSQYRTLLLESLEQRQLLSVSPFPKAILLPLNTAGIGSLSAKLLKVGQVDPYKFTAPLTGTLVIREVSGPGTVFPTNLVVYDANGNKIPSIYTATPGPSNYWATPGAPYNGLVAINVTVGSTYYATAAAGSNCSGPYSVQITPDDVGNTFASAPAITLIPASVVSQGGSATKLANVNYPGDVDMFSFTATVTGNMTIRETASGSNINSELTVFDNETPPQEMHQTNGSLATSGAPGVLNASVTIPVIAGNKYFAEVAAFANTTGAYLLQISTLPTSTPTVGHTFATATPILITPDPTNQGIVTTQPGTIGFAGDVDYYSFVAATTGQMTIRQYADVGSTVDSHLYIYGANQQLIWQSQHAGLLLNSGLITIPVAAGATYYAVAAGNNATTGAYVLSFVTVATTKDTVGTFANATPITVAADGSSKTSGTIDFTANSKTTFGDYDIYSYVAPASGTATFRATPTSGSLQTHTFIYDSTDTLLPGDGTGDVQTAVTGGNTYYVEVAGAGLTAGNYTLQSFITAAPPAPPPALADWTFMVYMDADNGLVTAAIQNFLQMASVGSNQNVNIVVEFARAPGVDNSYGNWSGVREGLVHAGDTPTATWGKSVGTLDMGVPKTLSNFVTWATAFAPASHYALDLWDHGGGVQGVCQDDVHNGDILSMANVSNALKGTPHLDLLGYDDCLMAMTEVGYQTAKAGEADVMVASEFSEWGDGWYYAPFLTDLEANSATETAAELGTDIVAAFQNYYTNLAPSYEQVTDTLSAVDLTKFGTPTTGFVGSLNAFATAMVGASATDVTAVQNAVSAAQPTDPVVPPATTSQFEEYRDIGDFMSAIGGTSASALIKTAAANVVAAMGPVIIANWYSGDFLTDPQLEPTTGLAIELLDQSFASKPVPSYYNSTISFVADVPGWLTLQSQVKVLKASPAVAATLNVHASSSVREIVPAISTTSVTAAMASTVVPANLGKSNDNTVNGLAVARLTAGIAPVGTAPAGQVGKPLASAVDLLLANVRDWPIV